MKRFWFDDFTVALVATASLIGCSSRVDIAERDVLTSALTLDDLVDVRAACERACSYGEECGTHQLPVPLEACDCVGDGCSCENEDACVSACLDQWLALDANDEQCAQAAAATLECLIDAPCAEPVIVGTEVWFDASTCDSVAVPGSLKTACTQHFAPTWTQPSGTDCYGGGNGVSDDEIDDQGNVVADFCLVEAGCDGETVELRCDRVDVETNEYACTCIVDGRTTSSYSEVNGCNWQVDGSHGRESFPYDVCGG